MPFSNQQMGNKPGENWCGGYLTIDNSTPIFYPEITRIKISDDSSTRYYNVPPSPSSYDVPETFHTGESYRLTFTVNAGISIPGFPAEDEWKLELKRPNGTVARRALFETDGIGSESIIINFFTPECLTYEVSVKPRTFFDLPL